MNSAEEIVEATLADVTLNARTTIENDRYRVVIEYPIRTMNANERDGIYQTDTGPVLLPDLSVEPNVLLENMELAFVAFNSPSWAEFLVRTATSVSDDVDVYHYSRPIRFDAVNEVIRVR